MKILKNPAVCQKCKQLYSYFRAWDAYQCKLTKKLYSVAVSAELNCENFVKREEKP